MSNCTVFCHLVFYGVEAALAASFEGRRMFHTYPLSELKLGQLNIETMKSAVHIDFYRVIY